MAFVGSAEIILILVVILGLIPILVILYLLDIIFRRAGRVTELEARVARLENALDTRTGKK